MELFIAQFHGKQAKQYMNDIAHRELPVKTGHVFFSLIAVSIISAAKINASTEKSISCANKNNPHSRHTLPADRGITMYTQNSTA